MVGRGIFMDEELLICVKSIASLETIKDSLLKKGFVIQEEFLLHDIYMVKENVDVSYDNLNELFSNYILISENVGKKITLEFHNEERDEKGEPIKCTRRCPIVSCRDAYEFMKALGYKKLLNLNNHNLLFSNGRHEICVQEVEDLGIYIEMKQNNIRINQNNGNDIQEMINNLKKYNLGLDESNFLVQISHDMLKKIVDHK